MLRLVNPDQPTPLVLSIDDSNLPTVFHVLPLSERDARVIYAAQPEAASSVEMDTSKLELIRQAAIKQVVRIDNIDLGFGPSSHSDPETISEIIARLPVRTSNIFFDELVALCFLSNRHAKNSDGSSALLSTLPVGEPSNGVEATETAAA